MEPKLTRQPSEPRVYLIHPPFHYFPGSLGGRLNYCRPPLGLCYLAGYARENVPCTISILDAMSLDLDADEVVKRALEFKPDLVGITVTTPTATVTREILMKVRAKNPEITLVVGGPHITPLPTDMIDMADFAVIREGEQTLVEIIECIRGERSKESIKGVAYREGTENVLTPPRPFIVDLDEFPDPARDLLDGGEYSHIYPSSRYSCEQKFTTIFTERGCAFDCHFCGNKILWGRTVRYRSLERVYEEIKTIVNVHKTHFFFIDDDDFSTNPKRVKAFCEGLIELGLDVEWVCHIRVNALSEEMLKMMRKAGCVEAQVGLESGTDEGLAAYNKRLTIEQMAQGCRRIRAAGINVWGTFIIGGPTDTPETVREMVNLSCRLPLTYCTFIMLLPFPGTELYTQYSEKGYLKTYDWSKYSWHGDPIFETETLCKADLIALRKEAYKRFYLRPQVLLRMARDMIKTRSYKQVFLNFLIWAQFVLQRVPEIEREETHCLEMGASNMTGFRTVAATRKS